MYTIIFKWATKKKINNERNETLSYFQGPFHLKSPKVIWFCLLKRTNWQIVVCLIYHFFVITIFIVLHLPCTIFIATVLLSLKINKVILIMILWYSSVSCHHKITTWYHYLHFINTSDSIIRFFFLFCELLVCFIVCKLFSLISRNLFCSFGILFPADLWVFVTSLLV